MSVIFWFGIEITISLFLSALVLVSISRPPNNVLQDLCPIEALAEFWLYYTGLMLLLAPLLVVLVSDSLWPSGDVLQNVKVTYIAVLAGLTLGLMIVGKSIFPPAFREYGKGNQE